MHRLFVAIRPPAAVRQALLATMGGVPHARWQDDDQLHLTLRFIGEVERPQAEEIAAALEMVGGPRPTLRIEGVGTFERRGVVHTLWAGLAADEALSRLRQRIDRAVTRAGVAAEGRAFRPHITLARLNRSALGIDMFLQRNLAFSLSAVTPESFALFESELGSDGATYHLAARYPLT